MTTLGLACPRPIYSGLWVLCGSRLQNYSNINKSLLWEYALGTASFASTPIAVVRWFHIQQITRRKGIKCHHIKSGICYLGDKPHGPNLSDLAECVILCTSWLQSPGNVSWICDLRTTLCSNPGMVILCCTSLRGTVLKSCSAEILHTWHQWTQRTK